MQKYNFFQKYQIKFTTFSKLYMRFFTTFSKNYTRFLQLFLFPVQRYGFYFNYIFNFTLPAMQALNQRSRTPWKRKHDSESVPYN